MIWVITVRLPDGNKCYKVTSPTLLAALQAVPATERDLVISMISFG